MSLRRRIVPVLLPVVLVVGCAADDRDDGRSRPTVPRPIAEEAGTTAPAGPDPSVTVGTRPASLAEAAAPSAAPPAAVRIDAIGLDTAVVPVGVESDGAMEVPPADQVGWYRFGPAPGAGGSAVLAAHVDFDGRPGAFFELTSLQVDDEVVVADADGSERTYRVTEIGQIAKTDLSASGVFDRSGPPRLALITCGGEFEPSARSYRDNVVVTAVPEA